MDTEFPHTVTPIHVNDTYLCRHPYKNIKSSNADGQIIDATVYHYHTPAEGDTLVPLGDIAPPLLATQAPVTPTAIGDLLTTQGSIEILQPVPVEPTEQNVVVVAETQLQIVNGPIAHYNAAQLITANPHAGLPTLLGATSTQKTFPTPAQIVTSSIGTALEDKISRTERSPELLRRLQDVLRILKHLRQIGLYHNAVNGATVRLLDNDEIVLCNFEYSVSLNKSCPYISSLCNEENWLKGSRGFWHGCNVANPRSVEDLERGCVEAIGELYAQMLLGNGVNIVALKNDIAAAVLRYTIAGAVDIARVVGYFQQGLCSQYGCDVDSYKCEGLIGMLIHANLDLAVTKWTLDQVDAFVRKL